MVFHPSHRPLEIATRFPQFHSPDDDDISPTNKKHKGTFLLGVDSPPNDTLRQLCAIS